MIAIANTLVSEDLLDKKFVCDLSACRGACCIEGDAGAPLNSEEVSILEDNLEEIKPFMAEDGIKAVEHSGVFEVDIDGDYVTPLVNNKHCAFVVFENDIAKCAIENAHKAGKTNFIKPISCHLYPVRVTEYKEYDAVNYHEWSICKPACACGEKLKVPVFKFLKEPLIRKYGKDWFEELELVNKHRK